MARADVSLQGLELLNRWPVVMHEIDWRFNQISGDKVRMHAQCQNRVYIQYERDYIGQALYDAAVQAREYLGFAPAPMWVVNEPVTLNSDLSWDGQTLQTRYGHLTEFGVRATSGITSGVTVVYSDTNDDQLDDLATITVSGVTDIDADEIKAYFRVADGALAAASDLWQITGLTVTKSGDTATITGPRWLFVHPKAVWSKEYAYQESNPNWPKFEGDANNTEHFVQQVDVYREYADATNAVQLLPNPALTDSPVSVTADIVDAEYGSFSLRTVGSQLAPGARPETVRVSYRAGLPLVNGRMDPQLETAIVRYSNTLMPQEPECCGRTQAMWATDVKRDFDNLVGYDAWHPPAFGVSNAGLKLASVVEARQNKLKGKPLRAS